MNARRLVAFDLETTGTDTANDRIVEISIVPVDPAGPAWTTRVHPGRPIPAEATRVHGISDADVAAAPRFADIAPRVQAALDGAILLGYNSRDFDTLLLDAELRRAGQRGLAGADELDALRVWRAVEPRTLESAVRRWLGREHDGAHGAEADAAATAAVWRAMRDRFGLTTADGVALTRPADEVDRAGKFVRDSDGYVLFNFGKHRGVRVTSVPEWRTYVEWMLKSDFPTSTKAVAARLVETGGRY